MRIWRQVVEPLYSDSRYRWRNYRRHLEPVMEILEPWIDYFGYDI